MIHVRFMAEQDGAMRTLGCDEYADDLAMTFGIGEWLGRLGAEIGRDSAHLHLCIEYGKRHGDSRAPLTTGSELTGSAAR